MHGNSLNDFTGLFAHLDLHHVGILAKQAPPICWDRQGLVVEFKCSCYLFGQVEFVVPYAGVLLDRLAASERLHHVALTTKDVEQECEAAKANGLKLLLDKPIKTLDSMLVNFILPEGRGVLIELVQEI